MATPRRSAAEALIPPDPGDIGAQSDLIGAPEPMSIEAVLADQIGGVARVGHERGRSLKVTLNLDARAAGSPLPGSKNTQRANAGLLLNGQPAG